MIRASCLISRHITRPIAGPAQLFITRTALFVPQRGRVNKKARPGKMTAKEKQDERRRARM
jgi:hypothetical protein